MLNGCGVHLKCDSYSIKSMSVHRKVSLMLDTFIRQKLLTGTMGQVIAFGLLFFSKCLSLLVRAIVTQNDSFCISNKSIDRIEA